jgi:hypothetical protein
MIEVIDNFLPEEEKLEFYNYCLSAPYHYGEVDFPGNPPTGMTSNIKSNNKWYLIFSKVTSEKFNIQSFPDRMYINLFLPNEVPYFHQDSNDNTRKTFLYYPNQSWDINCKGETSFIIDDEIKGILPIPNRAILFDSTILHSANSFRNKPRFTLASKY